MLTVSDLEFLLVSNDYAMLTAVSGGVKKNGAKLAVVLTAEEAREYVERRRIDGVFVDIQITGAHALIAAIRKGSSNGKAAIFACAPDAKESTATLSAGANFLLRKPLTLESVMLHITIAKDLMLRERRRYFRHAVNLPVKLRAGEKEWHVKMVNLSEGGMAVRGVKALKPGAGIEFAFELPYGEEIHGKGLVAWTNTEGMAGILTQTLQGAGREWLGTWLTAREKLAQDQGAKAGE